MREKPAYVLSLGGLVSAKGLLYQSKPSIENLEASTRSGRNCGAGAPRQLWCGLGVRLTSKEPRSIVGRPRAANQRLGGTVVRYILKSPCPMAANSAVAGPKHGRYKPFAVCGMLRHSPPAAELHGRPASHAFLRKRSANDGNRSPLAAQLKRGVAAAYCGLSPVSAIRGVGRSTTVIARRRQDRRRAAQEHEVSPRRRLSRPRVDRAADPRQ